MHVIELINSIFCISSSVRGNTKWTETESMHVCVQEFIPLFISFFSFPPPLQEVVNEVQLTVLSQHQYCVVLNPLGDDGRPRLGCRKLRQGPRTFFLHPGNQFIQACILLHKLWDHPLPCIAMHL